MAVPKFSQHFSFLVFSLLLIILGCCFWAIPPVGYAEVTLDGSLGPAKILSGPNFVIDAGDGTTVNHTNLFHSFGAFNLSSNESATFTGPDSISTIIGRITGGSQSSIDGLLRSSIPGADLFLVNPAGFLFGPHASLDVQGSFHATTADYLRLGEKGIIYSDPARSSVLTVDPPSAFGFLSDNPGAIIVQEAALAVPSGETLSLIGGDIEIRGTEDTWKNLLVAPGGRINLASVLSPGEVVVNSAGTTPDLNVDSFSELGGINIYEAGVDAGGDGGGTVVIRGGRLELYGSYIYASTKGPVGSGVPGSGIDIQAVGNVTLDNYSALGTNVFNGVADDSGGVRITADQLTVQNNSEIQSVAFGAWEENPTSSGNSGDIILTTNSLLLSDQSMIRAGTGGEGNSGKITVSTGTLEVKDNGIIFSPVFGGTGQAGDVVVTAEHIVMSNEKYPGRVTGINARTYYPGTGKGSDITVNTKKLDMSPGTEIGSGTWYLGHGGDIQVNVAGDAVIEGTRDKNSKGGTIYTGIFTNTFGSAEGGKLIFRADNLKLSTEAAIRSSTFSTGNAGAAFLDVGCLRIENAAFIESNGYFGTGGNAGRVDIVADSIVISGPESSSDPFGTDFTGISVSSGITGGSGGDINIVTGSLLMTNRGSIFSTAEGPDQGGDINIRAKTVEILNGAIINGSVYGSGNGGNINVEADSLRISGVHPEMYVHGTTGKETLAPSSIFSQAVQEGNGGTITVIAGRLALLDGGILSTDTYGVGNAGNIDIDADNLLVAGINDNLRDFLTHNGSDPKYAAAMISAGTHSLSADQPAAGNGGHINITTGALEMNDGGLIISETKTPGNGGDINITSQALAMFNGALVSTQSRGQGDAGNIYLGATDTFTMQNSTVSTKARRADGGNINFETNYLVHLVDSEVTSSVGGGADTVGGNISIDPEYVVLDNSRIIANAYEGTGGNIDIVADVFLADPASIVDASSALGVNGRVDIRAPITSISGTIAPLPGLLVSLMIRPPSSIFRVPVAILI